MSCQRLVIGAAALRTVTTLIDAIDNDEARHGGLLSRSTIRASDEVRVLLRSARQRRGELIPDRAPTRREREEPL
jgi:hypothetical protein